MKLINRSLIISVILTALTFSLRAEEATPNPNLLQVTTSKGQLTIELYPEKAPVSVANFLSYVEEGFYNDTIFHRVIPGFMIQVGGFTKDMRRKPTKAPIKNEANNKLHNSRGTLAMARTNNPNSATSQFFINVADNNYLDQNSQSYGYAVFGKVVEGMDIVDSISNVKTTIQNGMQNVPVESVQIINITTSKPLK